MRFRAAVRRIGNVRTFVLAAMVSLLLALHSTADAGPVVARISLSSQSMTVSHDGVVLYRWKVSTARPGYVTPRGRYRAYWASRYHRSRKYDDAPMPHAIFFHGGYAIHGTYDLKRLGRPVSHGCVRLHPRHAAVFFRLARKHGLRSTTVVITR